MGFWVISFTIGTFCRRNGRAASSRTEPCRDAGPINSSRWRRQYRWISRLAPADKRRLRLGENEREREEERIAHANSPIFPIWCDSICRTICRNVRSVHRGARIRPIALDSQAGSRDRFLSRPLIISRYRYPRRFKFLMSQHVALGHVRNARAQLCAPSDTAEIASSQKISSPPCPLSSAPMFNEFLLKGHNIRACRESAYHFRK